MSPSNKAPSKKSPPKTSPSKNAPQAVSDSAASAAGVRYFEFVEGNSSKFWEIVVAGSEHTVRYGRIGTDGRALTKGFSSEAAAQADAEKLIGKKTSKGYAPAQRP